MLRPRFLAANDGPRPGLRKPVSGRERRRPDSSQVMMVAAENDTLGEARQWNDNEFVAG